MISSIISRLVILLFGTLYPAYASYKAVRTKNVKEYVKWMMYWIVFALFTCAETFTDIFLSFWFPFYYEIKIILVIYLLSPATKGSSILYRKFVHPALTKREQEIDEYIAKAKEQGYHTVLNLGTKGVNYATTIIMQTAIKGGGGLVNQIRKSYSLGDLSTEKELRKKKKDSEDEVDEAYDEDPRLVRRRRGLSPRRTASSGSQVDLYFPEVDVFQRPTRTAEQNIPLSHIRSSEDISSGYSSTEPLYSGAKIEGREPLIRTASVGGGGTATRIRTRASVKTGLPRKSIMTEDESGWTPTEPDESQIETDDYPMSRSLPFPISGNFMAPFVRPEYQYLFGNLTQDQLFTLINNANFTPVSSSVNLEVNVDDKKSSRSSPSKLLKNLISDDYNNRQAQVETEQEFMNDDEKLPEIEIISESLVVIEKVPEVVEEGKKEEESKKEEIKEIRESEKVKEKEFEKINEIPIPVTVDELSAEKIIVKADSVDEKDNKEAGRSGKYNKRPAPIPPSGNGSLLDLRRDSATFEDAVDFSPNLEEIEIEADFCTPESSPILSRKETIKTEPEIEPQQIIPNQNHQTPLNEKISKKSKKQKTGESNISKMLHLPKIHIPFWHQKGSSKLSGSPGNISKNESFISLNTQDENEIFIPLKSEEEELVNETDTKNLPVREMSQSPSSKRKSTISFD